MRYPDGGGLSAEGRARREKLRLQAAQMFQQGMKPVQVARSLRVSTKSAYQWRRRWRAPGRRRRAGLHGRRRRGVPAPRRTAADPFAGRAGGAGPAAYGWREDQRWTLARITALITPGSSMSGTPCAAPRTCCTGSGSARRSRCTGLRSGMRRRSPRGGRRPGRRFEASGGDRGVDLL